MNSFSFAGESDIAMCEKEGLKFGDGTGRDSIPEECSAYFLKQVTPRLKKSSKDGEFSVHAYKNIIFIKDPKSKLKGQNIIAGKYTELEDIKAIALDEENKEVVVVEGNSDILAFSSVITGNVAPKRILKHKDLEHADELLVYKNQYIVLIEKKKEIIFFDRTANVDAPESKKNLKPFRVIKNVQGSELKLVSETDELLVIDGEDKSQSVFDLKKMKFLRTEKIPSKTVSK
jgi:hypothetical protein